MCTGGAIFQTFLSGLGFSSQQIYILSTVSTVTNIMTVMVTSQWGDRGNVLKKIALIQVPLAAVYLFYIPMCIWKSASPEAFWILMTIGLLQAVCVALHSVCCYRQTYYLYEAKVYGSVQAVSGISTSVVSLAVGVLLAWMADKMPYEQIMMIGCAVAAVLLLTSAILFSTMRPITTAEPNVAKPEVEKKKSLWELFRYPLFYRLIPANFMRGFGVTVVGYMAVVALDLGFDQRITTAMVSVQSAASLVACAFFGVGVKFKHPKFFVLLGSLSFMVIPLAFIKSEWLLLCVFALMVFGRVMIDYSMPAVLRSAIPVEISGSYNSWRMLISNTGCMLAGVVATMIPAQWLLIVTMVFQFVAGISYYSVKELD